jgi:hypothetical protein
MSLVSVEPTDRYIYAPPGRGVTQGGQEYQSGRDEYSSNQANASSPWLAGTGPGGSGTVAGPARSAHPVIGAHAVARSSESLRRRRERADGGDVCVTRAVRRLLVPAR